jgi:hypothetical protein
MLSTLLGQLQSYFSKYFFVASFFPLLGFTFANGIIAYFLFNPWQIWAERNIVKSTDGAFFATSLVVAIIFGAVVLSSLSTFLRQTLEGKWGHVSRFFTSAEDRRRQHLIQEREQAAKEVAYLALAPGWRQAVLSAQDRGRQTQPKLRGAHYPVGIRDKVVVLEAQKGQRKSIAAADLEGVVKELESWFASNNPNRDADLDNVLMDLWERTLSLIDYALDGADLDPLSARARHARAQNEFNSNFGPRELAPTKMGNICNTIQGYAMRRYSCNLESLWSNLQHVVRKDEKAQAALQEAKTQLDFLIACCWLTLLSSVGWAIVFLAFEPSRKGFLAATIGGPIVSYVWYRAAAEQYRSFADIAMTSFDVFRLALLEEMRLVTPRDVMHERLIWEGFDKLMKFGEEQNFFYEVPKKS